MAEKKKSAKKAPAKKTKARPAAKKPAPATKKKAAARKKSPAKEPVAPPAPRAAPVAAPPATPAGTVAADEVRLGHVMALRPRIHVGFKPSAFGDAKRVLAGARYASIAEAARAVAEKAIEISNDSAHQDPFSRR